MESKGLLTMRKSILMETSTVASLIKMVRETGSASRFGLKVESIKASGRTVPDTDRVDRFIQAVTVTKESTKKINGTGMESILRQKATPIKENSYRGNSMEKGYKSMATVESKRENTTKAR